MYLYNIIEHQDSLQLKISLLFENGIVILLLLYFLQILLIFELQLSNYNFQVAVGIHSSRTRSRGQENRISRRTARCTRRFGHQKIREHRKMGRRSSR